MQKKKLLRLCWTVAIMGVASCCNSSSEINETKFEPVPLPPDSYMGETYAAPEYPTFTAGNPDEQAMIFNKRVPPLNSLIVCRDKQCAPAELSKSREYIFNALAQLVDNNLDATALLCEGNAQTHVCVNPYLTVPAKIGVTPAYVYFDGVKIIDASIEDGKPALNLILGYNLSYNGQTPTVCKPDKAMLYVKNNNKVVLNGNGFKCDMTSVGTTTIRALFNVDYIDLDYGYIGGYYSIGLSGPAYGGGSGYSLIRLSKDAHPLSPQLMNPKQDVEEESRPVVKPEFKIDTMKANDTGAAKVNVPADVKKDESSKPIEKAPFENKPLTTEKEDASGAPDGVYYVEPSTSVELSPNTKSNSQAGKGDFPYEMKNIGFGPEFEEVYVDDLDEYIK